MSNKRIAAIINDIHKSQKGLSTEATVKIGTSKLLILQRAESSKHEDEAFQLYILIDELNANLANQKQKVAEQSRVITSLESTANQKASEILLLQNEVAQLKDMYEKELVANQEELHLLRERNSMLFTTIGILDSQLQKLPTKKSKLKDYKKFVASAETLLSEAIKKSTPKK